MFKKLIKAQNHSDVLSLKRYFRFILPLVLLLSASCNDKAEESGPKPAAAFSYQVDSENTLLVTFMNISESGASYQWDFGDNTAISNEENPSHTYLSGGTYNVTLTAKNRAGISATMKREITLVRTIHKVSILGDSYSTFAGYQDPGTNAYWYPDRQNQNDVAKVEQTWFYQLLQELDATMEKNNSFSGATVCNTGYNGANSTSSSFVTRMNNLGNPDLIIILGGTNDNAANSPLGEFKYSDWTENDLKSFRPAFARMLDYITKNHPNAIILNVINTDLKTSIASAQKSICEHYKVDYLELSGISKINGHPSISGMATIKTQITNKIAKIAK